MTSSLLPSLVVETGNHPSHVVIWLHGLGADGEDFKDIVHELKLPKDKPVRFIFPHAPYRKITINGGVEMRAWCDSVGFEITSRIDLEGVKQSKKKIEALIKAEKNKGIASEKMILAGFSQGGAIALQTALLSQTKLGGVMALSTYFPSLFVFEKMKKNEVEEKLTINKKIPIFLAHGKEDPVVPLKAALLSKIFFEKHQLNVTYKEYSMPHSLCEQEIEDISSWLTKRLNSK